MKKNLIIFLTIICMAIPIFNDIDAFVRQNSKLLVYNLIYTGNRESKIRSPEIC